MRRQVSLLLANGHRHAQHYPVGMVWTEASIVVTRQNHAMASEMTLLQTAVASVLSKEAGKQFRDLVKKLNED